MARAGSPRRSIERERLKHGSTHLDARADREDRVARAEQLVMSMPVMPITAARPLLRSALSFHVLPRKRLVLSDLIWQAGK